MSFVWLAVGMFGIAWFARARSTSRARQASIASLAAQVRRLRALAVSPHAYRPPTDDEPMPEVDRPHFDAASEELAGAGFTILDDLINVADDGVPAGRTRWFASRDARVVGWFGVARSAAGATAPVSVLLSTSPAGHYFSTVRGSPSVRLVAPPFVHRADCAVALPLADVIAAHVASVSASGTAWDTLEVRATAHEAVALFLAQHAAIAAWRATQPTAALLDADLRCILGTRHDELAALVRPLVPPS